MSDDYSVPPRRLIETIKCEFDGTNFYLTLGFYPNDRIGEVHISGFKHGSNVNLLMEDACALISALLQRFVSPEALHELVLRNPDGSPASLIGAAIFHLVERASEFGGGDGKT